MDGSAALFAVISTAVATIISALVAAGAVRRGQRLGQNKVNAEAESLHVSTSKEVLSMVKDQLERVQREYTQTATKAAELEIRMRTIEELNAEWRIRIEEHKRWDNGIVATFRELGRPVDVPPPLPADPNHIHD